MNIPAPTTSYQDYSHYGHTTLRENFSGGPTGTGTDPWSNYGLGGYGEGGDYLQQYYQYRAMALQQLSNGTLSSQEKMQWKQYLAQLDQWLAQYKGGGVPQNGNGTDWDPNNGQSGETNGPVPDYQDLNQVVFEKGKNFSLDVAQGETRTVHIFQQNVDINISSNAASVTTKVLPDDRLSGKKMLEITVTSGDGSVRKIYVHNIDRAKAKVNIHAASVENVDLSGIPPEFSGKIKKSELGGQVEKLKGTPPDEDNPNKWSNTDTVDYYATEGSETNEFYTDTLNYTAANRSHKIYVTKLGEHEYEIVEKDADGKEFRRSKVYQIDQLNFNGVDADNLYFKDSSKVKSNPKASGKNTNDNVKNAVQIQTLELQAENKKTSGGFQAWSDPTHDPDDQITVGGSQGSNDKDDLFPNDTPADSVKGNTAYYKTSKDVELHANDKDKVTEYQITAPGKVVLHGKDYGTTWNVVSYDPDNHKWVIEAFVDGDPNKKETFVIQGGPDTEVTVDAMSEASVEGQKDAVQIGGSGKGSGKIDTSKDTEPDEKDGKLWKYNGYNGKDVTLHAAEGHDSEINVKGEVKITLSKGQTAKVKKDKDNYIVEVFEKGKPITTFTINKKVKSINIDGPEGVVAVDKSVTSDKVKIQGKDLSQTDEGLSEISEKLGNSSKEVSSHLTFFWTIVNGFPDDFGFATTFVNNAFSAISKALKSGDWEELKKAMNGLSGESDTHRANAYQALFVSLYGALGPKKLKAVLAKMSGDDPDLFNSFKNAFKANSTWDLNPKQDGKSWMSGDWVSDALAGWKFSDVQKFIGTAAEDEEE